MRYFLHIFRSVCPIFFLIWSSICLSGQTPAYLHYDVGDGLPGNIVYCAAQDERGFMWFGTDKGLACFDGTRFRTFGVKEGLPDPEVLNLKLDSRGRLWISCFRKSPCYRRSGKIFTEEDDEILSKINSEKGSVCDFLEVDSMGIWITGNFRALSFLPNLGRDTVLSIHTNGPIIGMFEVDNKIIGVGSDITMVEEGLGVKSIVSGKNILHGTTFLGAGVSNNNVLVSTQEGLFLFQIKGGEARLYQELSSFEGRVFVDSKGRFWVASTKSGAICFDNSNSSLKNPHFFLQGKKVSSVFEDKQNNLWFCTIGDGIFLLPKTSGKIYTNIDGFLSSNITSLSEGSKKELVVGDDQGSIYKIRPKITLIGQLGDRGLNRVRQTLITDNNIVFAGTDLGFFELRPDGKILKFRKSNACKYFFKENNALLVGTASSLSRYTNSYDFAPLIQRRTTAIAKNIDGRYWIGGIEGLYNSDDNFLKNWGDEFPLLKSRVVSIVSNGDKGMWIVTSKDGLLFVKREYGQIKAVERINDYLTEPIENIQSVFQQDSNRLWLATNKGVFGIDGNYKIFHFDRYNGLPDNDVNSVLVQGDTLWAGTVSGLSKIVLNQKDSNDLFRTSFSALRYKIGDKNRLVHLEDSFSVVIKYKLPADASIIELDIAGLDYSSRGNMQYKCIVQKQLPSPHLWTLDNVVIWLKSRFGQGPDTSVLAGNNLNFGVYLPPGRYAITVRAINYNGVFSSIPAMIILDKPPLWFQVIWFYMVLWILAGYVVLQIFRGMLELRKMETIISELKLQALQLQINPHFIGNSINAIQQFFFPPDPSVASEYIATFTRLLRTTMDYSERPFVSLSEELSYDEDYLKMIQLRFDKRFYFTINVADGVDMETLFPTMLLQPVLENSTIHGLSPKNVSLVEIGITLDQDEMLTCTVTDNGVGVNQAKKNNNNNNHQSHGISLIERKITSLNDLYHFECKMEINDRSDIDPNLRGTQMKLTFYPKRILKIKQY